MTDNDLEERIRKRVYGYRKGLETLDTETIVQRTLEIAIAESRTKTIDEVVGMFKELDKAKSDEEHVLITRGILRKIKQLRDKE